MPRGPGADTTERLEPAWVVRAEYLARAGGIGVVARKLPESGLRRGPRRCLVVLGLSGGGARRQKVRGPPSRLHSSLLMVVHHFCAFPKRRNRPGAELRGGTHVAFGRSVPEFRLVQSCAPRARFVRGCFWLSRRSDAMALQTPFRTPASLPESLWWRSRECDSVHARSAVAPEISRRRASR